MPELIPNVERLTVADCPALIEPLGSQNDATFVYFSRATNLCLISSSLGKLQDDPRVKLEIDPVAVSQFLMKGVVVPPRTLFRNIHKVPLGHVMRVTNRDECLSLAHSYCHPYVPFYPPAKTTRIAHSSLVESSQFDKIIENLGKSISAACKSHDDAFLFHSAGKDSNCIALAIASLGLQSRFSLITHRSKGRADESAISKAIAKKLGFKHIILEERNVLADQEKNEIIKFFRNAPSVCADNVTLAYPCYLTQTPALRESILIDGGGNDAYFGVFASNLAKIFAVRSLLPMSGQISRGLFRSCNPISILERSSVDVLIAPGISRSDLMLIYPECQETEAEIDYKFDFQMRDGVDIFYHQIITNLVASEIHIQKVKNFADSIKSKLVLPFMDNVVSGHIDSLSPWMKYDVQSRINKKIIRNGLYKELGLDSDSIGKLGYRFDSESLINGNRDWILDEIINCRLFCRAGIRQFVGYLLENTLAKGWSKRQAFKLIYRLFILSAWVNHSKYVEKI